MRAEIADALRVAGVNFSAGYSPDPNLPANERLHASFNAHVWNWKLRGYYNYADFYDLFGPTKVSRKGDSLDIGHSNFLIFDTPRTLELGWNVAGYGGMDRLPDYQNVVATYRSLLQANLGLKYSFLERSQGAVDEERGTQAGLFTQLNYAGSKALPRFWATYDRGKLLPLRNSSLWLRSSAGKSFGNTTNPFANFYFGAFGNNYVDHGTISRYREYYSFPGVGLNAVPGTSFVRVMGEWNLPPLTFRRAGTTWLYGNWARLSLLSGALGTNFGDGSVRNAYFDLGAQMDFRVVLFTYLNTTFSAGYAGATDRNGHVSGEYMFSLKIL
jgi:hypothetical protein